MLTSFPEAKNLIPAIFLSFGVIYTSSYAYIFNLLVQCLPGIRGVSTLYVAIDQSNPVFFIHLYLPIIFKPKLSLGYSCNFGLKTVCIFKLLWAKL